MRRVLTRKDVDTLFAEQPEEVRKQKKPDDYLERVANYIPAEISAAFVAIDGILKTTSGVPAAIHWIVFFGLLLLTVPYAWRATRIKALPTPYVQIGIAIVSFAFWVLAVGGPFDSLVWYNRAYGSILLIMWTLFPPLFTGE